MSTPRTWDANACVTGCYTTVVKTVQIHMLHMGTLYLKGKSYPVLSVVIDNQYRRSKYTTYIDEEMALSHLLMWNIIISIILLVYI